MPKLSQALSIAATAEPRRGHSQDDAPAHYQIGFASATASRGTDGFLEAVQYAEDAYRKRVDDYGPRLFRHSDGSLKAERPENNHYSVATRQNWAAVVDHCRRTGGENEVEKSGHSFRFNVAVDHAEHIAMLQALRLQPEQDKAGNWPGLDERKTSNPLDDPAHILNVLKSEMHSKYEW